MLSRPIRLGLAGLAAGAVASAVGFTAPASAATPASCTSKTIFSGTALNASGPDDIAIVGSNIFVGFQNGVGSMGEANGAITASTLVELNANGTVLGHWSIPGKIDGLGADVAGGRVLGTVNEDGNSAFFSVTLGGTVTTYTYSPTHTVTGTPNYIGLAHDGGTDAISVFGGQIYVSASAPSSAATAAGAPAVYQVTLSGTTATVSPTAINDNSTATVINGGGTATLALTDPDSNTVVPAGVPSIGGDFMLDSQGDGQLIFASSMAPGSALKVLNLVPGGQVTSVDDTAFPTQSSGALIATTGNTVSAITCPFVAGTAYSSVTPSGANNAPSTAGPNYLASLNLTDGTLTPVLVDGAQLPTKGLAFLPITAPVVQPAVARVVGPHVNTGATAQASDDLGLEVGLGALGAVVLTAGGVLLRRRSVSAE